MLICLLLVYKKWNYFAKISFYKNISIFFQSLRIIITLAKEETYFLLGILYFSSIIYQYSTNTGALIIHACILGYRILLCTSSTSLFSWDLITRVILWICRWQVSLFLVFVQHFCFSTENQNSIFDPIFRTQRAKSILKNP